MAELKQLKDFHGMALTLSDTDYYDLNLIYCLAETNRGHSYESLDAVIKTVFEIGMQQLKDELETQLTLKSIAQQTIDQ